MAEILTVGLPTLAVLIGILVNNSRLADLRSFTAAQFEAERRTNDANFGRFGDRVDSLEKVLLGKIQDIDNRLSCLEDPFGR
jgi:hypothetical protein